MGEQKLSTTEVERDLGIMITADGKNKAQVEASWILGRIKRTFKYFDIHLFKKLYQNL